jgi:hypothetical protein
VGHCRDTGCVLFAQEIAQPDKTPFSQRGDGSQKLVGCEDLNCISADAHRIKEDFYDRTNKKGRKNGLAIKLKESYLTCKFLAIDNAKLGSHFGFSYG